MPFLRVPVPHFEGTRVLVTKYQVAHYPNSYVALITIIDDDDSINNNITTVV